MSISAICVYDFTLSYCDNYNHDNLISFFNSSFFKKYSFQGEEGANSGYRHYQGRFSLTKPKRISAVIKYFSKDFPEIHLSPTSKQNMGNDFYVTKDDTRIEGPWRDPINTIYIPKQFQNKILYDWQKEVLEMSRVFNDREVNLIFDPVGNNGKSTLASIGELMYDCIDMPPINDMKELIQVACGICKGKNIRSPMAIFMDMPRAMDKSKLHGIYTAIEQIKKGKLYDVRYKYEEWWIDSPAVWVFSNIPPDPELLSRDRWKYWKINNRKLEPLKTFNQYGTSDF